MDSFDITVVTAIRDTAVESYIASAAKRLGWSVSFRATDYRGLRDYVDLHPEVVLLASQDFFRINEVSCHRKLLLQPGESWRDSDLQQRVLTLLHSREINTEAAPTIKSPVIVFASVGRRLGVTNFAINYAAEAAELGHRVLLMDAHLANPTIAMNLNIHGVRKSVTQFSENLSIVEVDTFEMVRKIAETSTNYDYLIIDLGEVIADERLFIGQRLQDIVTRISLQSTSKCNLLIEESSFHINPLISRLDGIKKLADISDIQLFALSDITRTSKERRRILEEIRVQTGLETFSIPYDRPAIESQRVRDMTLPFSAPRSTLRRHIERYCREQLEIVDMRRD